MKFLDGFAGVISVTLTGVPGLISHNVVPQGADASSRNGRKITVRSLEVTGSMVLPSTVTLGDMDQRCRIIFYIDKQTNGGFPFVDQLLASLPEIGTPSIFSFYDLNEEGRFVFIYDEIFDLPVRAIKDSTGENAPSTTSFGFSRDLNVPIEYDQSATTGAIGTQRTNNIGSLLICEQAAVQPTVAYGFRIRYTDSC